MTTREIKAWGILEEGRLAAWGTPPHNTSPTTHNVWQYPLFPTRQEAKDWLSHKGGVSDAKTVKVVITYTT